MSYLEVKNIYENLIFLRILKIIKNFSQTEEKIGRVFSAFKINDSLNPFHQCDDDDGDDDDDKLWWAGFSTVGNKVSG